MMKRFTTGKRTGVLIDLVDNVSHDRDSSLKVLEEMLNSARTPPVKKQQKPVMVARPRMDFTLENPDKENDSAATESQLTTPKREHVKSITRKMFLLVKSGRMSMSPSDFSLPSTASPSSCSQQSHDDDASQPPAQSPVYFPMQDDEEDEEEAGDKAMLDGVPTPNPTSDLLDTPIQDNESDLSQSDDDYESPKNQNYNTKWSSDEDENGGYQMRTPASARRKGRSREILSVKKRRGSSSKQKSKQTPYQDSSSGSESNSSEQLRRKYTKQKKASADSRKSTARKPKARFNPYKTVFASQGIALPREFTEVPIDELSDENPTPKGPRRSMRARMKPLAYWKGERFVYGPNDFDEDTYVGLTNMPVVQAICRAEPDKFKKRKVAPYKNNGKKKMRKKEDGTEFDEDEIFDSTKLRKKFNILDDGYAFVWNEETGKMIKDGTFVVCIVPIWDRVYTHHTRDFYNWQHSVIVGRGKHVSSFRSMARQKKGEEINVNRMKHFHLCSQTSSNLCIVRTGCATCLRGFQRTSSDEH
jgi:centromere protein C